MSGFVGREAEKAAVTNLLERTRLLTLTGSGGSGKTRLALEAARDVQDRYPDGVWLVELGPLAEAERIAQTTAFALGLAEKPDRPIFEQLAAHLAHKTALLVLDNCEHLIDDCARFAHALLNACPHLHIFATSREPLHIAGETTWLVPTLSLPDWQPGMDPAALRKSEAVQLLVERIRAVRPDFALDQDSAAPVYQICRKLDGIPLAIELAAARASVLSLDEIAARVDSALPWLESPDRLAPPRQQTLRAALDWSYDLLAAHEQRLFRHLSVFSGGFSLRAVEQISAADGLPAEQALALLYRLVDKSFVVRAQGSAPASRYRMLRVVRQYAAEKLTQAGEEQSARERHFRWCLEFAQQAQGGVISADRAAWIARVESELPNLRQALTWSLSGQTEPALAHQLVTALAQFWQLRGYIREGMDWIEAALACPGVPQPVLAETYNSAAFIAQHLWLQDRALQYAESALEIWRALGDSAKTGMALCYLGLIYLGKQNFSRARRLFRESLEVLQPVGPQFAEAMALMQFGDMAFIEGDYEQAERYYIESLAVSDQVGNLLGSTRRRVRLAQAAVAKGDLARAQPLLAQSIPHGRSDRWSAAMTVVTAASLAWAQGRLEYAARCLGMAEAYIENFHTQLWPVDRLIIENHQRLLTGALGDKAFAAAVEQGRQQAGNLDGALDVLMQGLQGGPDPVRPRSPAEKQAAGGLTLRELEVAALIARGKNNAEIAAALHVVVRTVEAHVTHILTKLNFTSRTQIAVWSANRENDK